MQMTAFELLISVWSSDVCSSDLLSTLDFSGGVDAMQGRLNELMKVAGAKFWASVGGIVASIVLRSYDYRFGKRINDGLSTLCDKLEHGMAYRSEDRRVGKECGRT